MRTLGNINYNIIVSLKRYIILIRPTRTFETCKQMLMRRTTAQTTSDAQTHRHTRTYVHTRTYKHAGTYTLKHSFTYMQTHT